MQYLKIEDNRNLNATSKQKKMYHYTAFKTEENIQYFYSEVKKIIELHSGYLFH